MSGSNGQAHVAEEMRDPVRPLRAEEMSSQQRNALLDEMVAVVNRNARALSELRRVLEAQSNICTGRWNENGVHHARIGGRHLMFVSQTLWQRLRWLVTGR